MRQLSLNRALAIDDDRPAVGRRSSILFAERRRRATKSASAARPPIVCRPTIAATRCKSTRRLPSIFGWCRSLARVSCPTKCSTTSATFPSPPCPPKSRRPTFPPTPTCRCPFSEWRRAPPPPRCTLPRRRQQRGWRKSTSATSRSA